MSWFIPFITLLVSSGFIKHRSKLELSSMILFYMSISAYFDGDGIFQSFVDNFYQRNANEITLIFH